MAKNQQTKTDASAAIRRAAAQAKASERVPHIGTPHHIPHDPDHYKHMSNFSKKGSK